MEDEVRRILGEATDAPESRESLADAARSLFGPEHGVDLDLPRRDPARDPPSWTTMFDPSPGWRPPAP